MEQFTTEELLNRLNQFYAQISAAQKAPVPPSPVSIGMDIRRPHTDLNDERYAKFFSHIPEIKLDKEYMDLPDIREGRVQMKTSFKDDELLDQPALILERLSISETARLGRMTLPRMRSGFSQQCVAKMFCLMYQLRDPDSGDYVFNGYEDLYYIDDKSVNDLPDMIMDTKNPYKPIPPTADEDLEASVYAFIAASTLRLYVKPKEDYIKAYNNILNAYQRFYKRSFNNVITIPHHDALQTLSYFYTKRDIFKNTLFRILYLGSGDERAEGMKRFLYEIPLTNTGLHAISIFTRLAITLGCPPGLLIAAIESKQYERAVEALKKVLQLSACDAPEYSRQMWRFGRVFNDAFMCELQTKRCPGLVYALASALRSEAYESNKDILNIKQLEEVSPANRPKYAAVGRLIVMGIRHCYAKDGIGG